MNFSQVQEQGFAHFLTFNVISVFSPPAVRSYIAKGTGTDEQLPS